MKRMSQVRNSSLYVYTNNYTNQKPKKAKRGRKVSYRPHVEKAGHDLSDALHTGGYQQAIDKGPCQRARGAVGQRKAAQWGASPPKLVHLEAACVATFGRAHVQKASNMHSNTACSSKYVAIALVSYGS